MCCSVMARYIVRVRTFGLLVLFGLFKNIYFMDLTIVLLTEQSCIVA